MIRRFLAAAFERRPAPAGHDLMTLDEVAAQVGVAVPVIRRRMAMGDIPAARAGRTVQVERAAPARTIARPACP